ncbi:MAG: hypothetical protein ABI644_00275, partial [Arenimonas sp.]
RMIHIAKGGRDRVLAARTDMTIFLSDAHMLPTDRKGLLEFTANKTHVYSEDPNDSAAGYFAVLACTGTARLSAMEGKPFALPKALASLQPATATALPTTTKSGALSQADIQACTNEIHAKQIESQSWGGNVDDVAARLGQFQKDLFEGRCAAHPEAQAYINGANRMLGYTAAAGSSGSSSNSSAPGKNGKRSNVPEANASNCLAPQKEGGVINNCAFAVEYSYCVVQPKPGSWAASFDCNQGKSGSWQVGPNSRAIMQTAGLQVAFFGCRYGPTLGKPDGISPADFRYNPNGLPSGRCREWGAP